MTDRKHFEAAAASAASRPPKWERDEWSTKIRRTFTVWAEVYADHVHNHRPTPSVHSLVERLQDVHALSVSDYLARRYLREVEGLDV